MRGINKPVNYEESVICISLVIRELVYRYFQIVTVHVCVVIACTGIQVSSNTIWILLEQRGLMVHMGSFDEKSPIVLYLIFGVGWNLKEIKWNKAVK